MLKKSNVFFSRAFGKVIMLSVHWNRDERSDFVFLSLCVEVHSANRGADACVLSGKEQSGSSPAFFKQLQQDWKSKAGVYSDLMKPLSCGESSYLVSLRQSKRKFWKKSTYCL